MANQLGKIDHVVQLMLENRSFDHMLDFLYADSGNRSPAGQNFDGLTGEEWDPDDLSRQVKVYRIRATDQHHYLMPGADPDIKPCAGCFARSDQIVESPLMGEDTLR